jgi:hypothetical protein
MNECGKYRGVSGWVMWLRVLLFAFCGPTVTTAVEQTFATFQVGSHVYTNVTVTTKARNYIFILHSTGMENIKVADLSDDVRTQLGYVPEVPKGQKASNWAKGKMAEMHIGEVKAAELNVQKKWREQSAVALEKVRALDRKLCGAIMGGLLLMYLFYSYCCMLICQKTGQESGMLVWFPVLQLFPLLEAAGMSPICILGYILPGANIITHLYWCFKIAKARGKSAWAGFWLALPPTSLLAFLYLAFSEGVAPTVEKEDRRASQIMTLETV